VADLGPLAVVLHDPPVVSTVVRLTVRNAAYNFRMGTAVGPAALAGTVLGPIQCVHLPTPQWWGGDSLGGSAPPPTYELRGRVLQEDEPIANVRVALFFRRLNLLIAMQRSDANGYVHFKNLMPGDQQYYAIALDPAGSPLQNSIIWDRLSSVPAT
jgi:hypothetical protein